MAAPASLFGLIIVRPVATLLHGFLTSAWLSGSAFHRSTGEYLNIGSPDNLEAVVVDHQMP